jgi:hypothetical protein
MTNNFAKPDNFSVSPLLILLPRIGSVGRLETLVSPLYARYEKVSQLLSELDDSATSESRKRLVGEQAMLKQVLDWVATRPESGRE